MDISRLLTSPLRQPPSNGNTGLQYEFIPSALSQFSEPLTVASLPNTLPMPPPGQPPRPSTVTTRTPSISSLATTFPHRPFVDTGGATSFASRNPLKDVQPPRFRVRNSKSDAVKLGQAERIAARARNTEELRNGVDAIIRNRDREIKDLAEQLDVGERNIRVLINGDTHYKKHREPNMFNALVHKATYEMNTGNISSNIYFKIPDEPPRP